MEECMEVSIGELRGARDRLLERLRSHIRDPSFLKAEVAGLGGALYAEPLAAVATPTGDGAVQLSILLPGCWKLVIYYNLGWVASEDRACLYRSYQVTLAERAGGE